MKKIITPINTTDTILLSDIDREEEPIFAKKKGKIVGMLVSEEYGWVLRIGGRYCGGGHQDTIEECIAEATKCGYEFYIESD